MTTYEMYDPIIMNTVHSIVDAFKHTIQRSNGRLQQDPFISEGYPSTAKWNYKVFSGRGWFVFLLPTGARNPIRAAFNAARKTTGMGLYAKAKFKRESTGFIGDFKSSTDKPEILESTTADHVLTAYLTSEFEANRGIGMLSVEVTYVPRKKNPGKVAPLLDNPPVKQKRRPTPKELTAETRERKKRRGLPKGYTFQVFETRDGPMEFIVPTRYARKKTTRKPAKKKKTSAKKITKKKTTRKKKTSKRKVTRRTYTGCQYGKGKYKILSKHAPPPKSVSKRTLKSEDLVYAVKTNTPHKNDHYWLWLNKKTDKVTGKQKDQRKKKRVK